MKKTVVGSHPVGVSHEILGRMRVRMAKSHNKHEHLTKVHDALQKLPHVDSVKVSPRTGSLVVHHNGTPEALSAIASTIAEVGTEMLEAVVEGESLQVAGIVLVVHLVVKNISALVMRISERAQPKAKLSRVVHKSPGRTRVKLSKQHWCDVHKLEAALNKLPGVHGVHVNHRTKSVIVHHEEHETAAERVGETFEKVAVDLVKSSASHSVPFRDAPKAGLGILASIFLSDAAEGDGRNGQHDELRKLLLTALLLYVVFKVRKI